MKISPVTQGTVAPQPSNTGLAPEKLARLKAIAAGQGNINVEEREEDVIPKPPTTQRRIKMNVSQTPPVGDGPLPVLTGEPEEIAISDTNEQTNVVPEATEPLSPQLAMLAKQRRALQVKESELAAREKALTGPTRVDLEAKLKTHALSTLQELGITYDQLTQEILAQQSGHNPDIETLKAKIEAMEKGIDEKLSAKDQQAETAVLAEMRRNVDRLAQDGDDFEMIRETQSHQDVIDLIHRTWKKTGEVLDEREAMNLVEEELINESLKLARLKKIQGKLLPTESLQPQPQGIQTLTNKDQAKPAIGRKQRAMLAFAGNLKR